MIKPTIVVWFSCGAASAVAAKLTLEKYGNSHTVRIVNNPVIEEDPDNLRFLKDVEKWLGVTIEFASNSKYPDNSAKIVWQERKFMSGVKGAPCTTQLKKEARYEWEKNNKHDYLVMGFTKDEKARHDRFALTERINILPILIDANLSKNDCFEVLKQAGIELPRVYKMGYPNANCIGCVKATSPTYWNLVKEQHPSVFWDRAIQSRDIGVKLVRHKGKRIFLDQLPDDAKGHKLKSMPDCGIFCEEK